jgi:Na+/melibiose symporter-like transporter
MMGILADRTKTRRGKFLHWAPWSALPWGIVMVLASTTPGLSATGTIIYACATNILLTFSLYPAIFYAIIVSCLIFYPIDKK